ncbi:unnamed protein product [Sphenostylis stenocarpa]|uniref:Uncharacterized protein n=1 Tax=Sphenostylis stenocarpa TaxID=92480 RepID=A0AA86S8Y1_9FABA|nr:unnamed protein product [Sphenostylis stenocarpa]
MLTAPFDALSASFYDQLVPFVFGSIGQELELDLDDKSSVGLSHNNVLPSHQYRVNVKKISKNNWILSFGLAFKQMTR